MDLAKSLISRKESLQAELDSQFSILKANNSTLQTPLVDSQGFPRADIDVYAVRHARVRIIELRNDLRAVVDELAVALEKVYDPATGVLGSQRETIRVEDVEDDVPPSRPFARVDGVAPASPAAQAGLKREDLILKFGTLTANAFAKDSRSLLPLATFVSTKENVTFDVLVQREVPDRPERQTLTLKFTPRNGWGGKGMLGCHIVPYT